MIFLYFQKNEELKSPRRDTRFIMKLTISEKVEVRKTLFRKENESIDDFFGRCCDAQYVVSDNEKDVSFEREVLLHFLFGLVLRIREKVLIANCSNSEDYIVDVRWESRGNYS